METIIHNIRDLSEDERLAAEQLVGHELRDHHQIIIQVVGDGTPSSQSAQLAGTLPAWCNVYEGLTEAEIADIEQSIVRSDSTRFGD